MLFLARFLRLSRSYTNSPSRGRVSHTDAGLAGVSRLGTAKTSTAVVSWLAGRQAGQPTNSGDGASESVARLRYLTAGCRKLRRGFTRSRGHLRPLPNRGEMTAMYDNGSSSDLPVFFITRARLLKIGTGPQKSEQSGGTSI